MSGDQLPSWRATPAKHSITEFAAAVTSPESAGFVPEQERVAVFDNDGDLAMLQWAAASPRRTLQLVVRHTDGEREYAYDRDPVSGSGTGHLLAAAAEHKWTMIDMAADWSAMYPPLPHTRQGRHAR